MTQDALREAVKKRLGRDPFTASPGAAIAIDGEDFSSGGRFRARVKQTDSGGAVLGSRELDLDTCGRLFRATTIVVALFIDQGDAHGGVEETVAPPDTGPSPTQDDGVGAASAPLDGQPTRHETEPNPTRIGVTATTPHRSRERAASTRTGRPLTLWLGAGGGATIGLLPATSATFRGVARLEREGARWSVEWSGGYSLPQSFERRSVRGSIAAVEQQLRACVTLTAPTATLGVDACGGLYWGALVPRTAGVRERSDAWRPVAGPTGAVAVHLRDGPRAARLELALTVPPVARNLYFQSATGGNEPVHTSGHILGFLGLSGHHAIF